MRIAALNTAHDASVCSIKDGKVEFFCKEERLSRVKRDKHPFKSLDLYRSLDFGPVDHFLYAVPSNIEPDIEITYSSYIKKNFKIELENYSSLSHHACHASLAYYNSGFDEAIVIVVDRNGSIFFVNGSPVARESESVFVFSDTTVASPIYKRFWLHDNEEHNKNNIQSALASYYPFVDVVANSPYGVVKVYEAATTLIGQNVLENGKTMGLSAYGEKTSGQLFFDSTPIGHLFTHDGYKTRFSGFQDKTTTEVTKNNYKLYANMAKKVQTETQDEVLKVINKYVSKTGINKVCIVGGYGLNVVANSYYITSMPEVDFYFEPVSDDTGVTIGATMLKYKELTGLNPEPLKDTFYHYYDASEPTPLGKSTTIRDVCTLLLNQKSVAVFEGAPESGPRALGHRSILFDPRTAECKDLINKVKNREWYRPFAGVILEEEFENYFYTMGLSSSPNMTINFEAKSIAKEMAPGVIHVDGTSRIQTVSSGFLYELLKEFYGKTGCPILLNTSFNLAGEPLVQTKMDALITLNNSDLDYIYFVNDGILVAKDE